MRITIVVACFAFFGCASVSLEEKSAGHVILPSAGLIGEPSYSEEWLPDEAQIVRLEKEIGHLFARPDLRMRGLLSRDGALPRRAPFPLSEYFIRYCGVVKDGKRLVIGKAARREISATGRALYPSGDTAELSVFGGGTHFFTVIYDPKTSRVLEVSYNAPL